MTVSRIGMDEYVLLDTNVWSMLVKEDSRAALFKVALSGKRLSVSFITVAEVYKWQFSRHWGEAKSRQMSAALRRYVVVPYQERIAEFWGKIASATDSIGRQMSDNDCTQAAIDAGYLALREAERRGDGKIIKQACVLACQLETWRTRIVPQIAAWKVKGIE